MKTFDKCAICQFFTSQVKYWTDGQPYCSIHYQRKVDEVVGKERYKKGQKWINWFRQIISGEVDISDSTNSAFDSDY